MRTETDRLLLRLMTMADTDELLRIFSDPRVMESFEGTLFDRARMAEWVRRNVTHQEKYGYGLFSVILKSEGRLIGDCGLEHVSPAATAAAGEAHSGEPEGPPRG